MLDIHAPHKENTSSRCVISRRIFESFCIDEFVLGRIRSHEPSLKPEALNPEALNPKTPNA